MDRSIPMFNRVVVERLQKKNMELHQKRLDKIKTNPIRRQTYSVIRVDNSKGFQLEEERRTEIEKQNVILFNKMNRIMNRSQAKANHSVSHSREIRLREQNDKIYEENRAIVNRIGNQKPTISTKKLYEDRVKREKLLKFMGRYPYRTQYNSKDTQQDSQYEEYGEMHDPREEDKPKTAGYQIKHGQLNQLAQHSHQSNHTQQNFREKSQRSEVSDTKKLPPVQKQHNQLIPLFRRRKQLNGQWYLVQLNRLYRQYQFKLTHLISQKEYSLYMTEQQGNALLTQNDYDYNHIVSCFCIDHGKLELQMTPRIEQSRNLRKSNKVTEPAIIPQKTLFNEDKLKNFRLKQQTADQEAQPTPKQPPKYNFQDLQTYHQDDIVHGNEKEHKVDDHHEQQPFQNSQIHYEQALDQQLQEV